MGYYTEQSGLAILDPCRQDWLSWNGGPELPLYARYILSQKSEDLIYIAEAWIHTCYIICSALSFLCHKCVNMQNVFIASSWNS
jgi:hypothetical protein